ncbi:MAG: tRNA lysidine(34) synthetase TilS [Tepidibacillus sp.]
MQMLRKIKQTIEAYQMIETEKPIIIGLSGGPDSMVLLDALSKITSNPLVAVHLNHQLRGKESDDDAQFVLEQCKKRNIPIEISTVNIADYMKETGLGTEEAGREKRYQFYYEVAQKRNADMIALGHHLNDQAETVLMRIIRGTGVHGLGGIPYVRVWKGLKIIRPLLDITRQEIEDYSHTFAIPYRTDKSNFSTNYFRNQIRLEIIPYLKKYNQQINNHLHHLGKITQDEDKYVQKLAEEVLEKCIIEKNTHSYTLNTILLQKLEIALQRRLIHLILSYLILSEEFGYKHIEDILYLIRQKEPSKSLDLPGIRVYRNYDQIVFTTQMVKTDTPSFYIEMEVPGEATLSFIGKRFKTILSDRFLELEGIWAVFDYEKLNSKEPIIIRSRMPGDRMTVFGMQGTKKVKDLFIDEKIPKSSRDLQPIIEIDREIIWIPGVKRSNIALISEQTKKFLYIIMTT